MSCPIETEFGRHSGGVQPLLSNGSSDDMLKASDDSEDIYIGGCLVSLKGGTVIVGALVGILYLGLRF